MTCAKQKTEANVWRLPGTSDRILIVIDLSMPVLDGWGVFRELRADQSTRTIPCMAVTAHADLTRSQAMETGFSAYVSKPFSIEALLKTVAEVLANRKLANQDLAAGGTFCGPQ